MSHTFIIFILSFSPFCASPPFYLSCVWVKYPCKYLFLTWSHYQCYTPSLGLLYLGSGVPSTCCGTWYSFICRAHIPLQDLQVVVLMLHKMPFCISHKVVALHLDKSTAEAYLCNEGHTGFLLSRLAHCILNMANMYGITLIPAYIPTHLNVEADFHPQDWFVPKWHLFLCIVHAVFIFGVNQRWICSSHVPNNVSDITPWKILYLWGTLWLGAFNHPLM